MKEDPQNFLSIITENISTMKKTSKHHISKVLFISSLLFIVFIFSLAIISLITQKSLFESTNNETKITGPSSIKSSSDNSSYDDIRVLIGILTLPDRYLQRNLLRTVYGTQPRPLGGTVDVKFVFCNLTSEEHMLLISLEIMRYNDIIILDCKENMNDGKSYTYFSSLPEMLVNNTDENRPYPPYHYVMKADDDAYFITENLVRSLIPLARDDLYYGFVVPCESMDPFVDYMAGFGYLVSWDIVEWVSKSDIPKTHLQGHEDRVFGEWLKAGNRAKNRFNGKWFMYDYPEARRVCGMHDFWPETIGVHKLKSMDKWIKTLSYFNVTKNLKTSTLYHIP